ncbi:MULTISPECIES: sporulation integral membrane protein YlbJ [Bacillus]|uniref:sporulation integral membrane protein YlbJ n=1 Tax=Bacillus TaxID=1386 RepID=UPI000BB937A9|nr:MULTISPECIES: sporulation integral membrane protein YlbJ [Bacillus]
MDLSKLRTIIFAFIITFLTVSLILFPKVALEASIRGLKMWWEVVFPSLLPFFIISELLIAFGVVAFIGVLFEPLMRPIFRVPGVGGFVLAMGMASGYPSGAKLTARLRQEKQITKIEAERLVSFTNSSNPLFIFGAISIGFFHNPKIGIILAMAHYLGNILVGVAMRFHGGKEKESLQQEGKSSKQVKSSLKEAFRQLHRTRIKNNKPFGKLLGDAVSSSVQTLLMIGGFIILFSVLNNILTLVNVTALIAGLVSVLLSIFHLSKDFSLPLISGIFEITLGAKLTSEVTGVGLKEQVIVTSFFLAFCGFSVQAQVASILAETDIRFTPFFLARILHAFFAATLAYILWEPLNKKLSGFHDSSVDVPVFSPFIEKGFIEKTMDTLATIGPPLTLLFLTIYILITFTDQKRRRTRM